MTGMGMMAKDRFMRWTGLWSQIITVVVISQLLFPAAGDAQDELSKAQASIARRDFKAAVAVLQAAVKQTPNSAEAHYLLGVALKGAGRSDEAMAEFQEALKFKVKYAEPQFEIGLLQLEKGQYAEAEATFRKGLDQQIKPPTSFYYGLGLVKTATDSLKAATLWLIRATEADPRKGAYHKALGDVYAKQQVTELAIDEYGRALELEPHSAEVHYAIGKLYFKDRKWQETVKAWKEAVATDSNFVPVYADLINFFLIMKPPHYEEAIPFLKKAVEFNPNDTKLPVELAKAMGKTPSYRAEALPFLEKAATLVPEDVEVHALIGDLSLEKKDYARAVQAYKKATQIDPNLVAGLKGLAEAQKASGDTTAAIATLQKIAEKDTSSNGAGVEGALGLLLYNQGRYDEAIPNLKEKLRTAPKVAILYRLLGLSYIKQNDFGAVLSDVKPALDSAVAAYPDVKTLSAVYSDLGGELFKAKRYSEAIEMFHKRLEADPGNWSIHLNVGNAYLQLKAYSKAVESYKKVAQYKPDNVQAYYWQGVCYSYLKSDAQAKAAFLKTLELDPKNEEALKQVGFAYLLEAQALQKAEKHKESQKVAAQAVGYFQRAVAQKSGDEQAHVWLAQGYVLSKQLEKAKEEFRRVLRMNPNNKDAKSGLERLEGGP